MGVLFAKVDGEWVEVVGGGAVVGPGAPSYTHVQGVAATVWTITHDLGYMPNITVVDSAHEVVEGDVIYGPVGTISIIFSAAFAGTAYLS